jgi:glycosyltransferase involved in cell wall biosynthesis
MMVSDLKPKVTIGICGKNCQDTVQDALKSVVKQDYPHESMEIVFVDDGSQDNTVVVVKDYLSQTNMDQRVFCDEWRGIGKARNTVIQNARGDYIVWVDADEVLTTSFVREQIEKMEQNPKAGIVTGRMSILDNENLVLALELIPIVVEYSRQDWQQEAKLPGTGGATYRVVATKQVGGFDEELSELGEDIEIASRIRKAGWSIIRGSAIFFERHGKISGLTGLLRRNFRQGIQSRKLYRKTGEFFSLTRMNPFASVVAGILYAVEGYKLTRRKTVFLLPYHFALKMVAWFYGFCKG